MSTYRSYLYFYLIYIIIYHIKHIIFITFSGKNQRSQINFQYYLNGYKSFCNIISVDSISSFVLHIFFPRLIRVSVWMDKLPLPDPGTGYCGVEIIIISLKHKNHTYNYICALYVLWSTRKSCILMIMYYFWQKHLSWTSKFSRIYVALTSTMEPSEFFFILSRSTALNILQSIFMSGSFEDRRITSFFRPCMPFGRPVFLNRKSTLHRIPLE